MSPKKTVPKKQAGILKITKSQQYKTIDELFEKSQPNSIYYTLLFLSSLIIGCGLLLNNSTIVVGGVLVTPLLTPILLIGLGISVGELSAIKNSIILVFRSIVLIILVSFILGLIFGASSVFYFFGDSMRLSILYFVVAFVSGVAATIAWTRKEIAEILPGLAVAVSLVPPLSMFGITLSIFDFEVSRLTFLVFIFNFAGVVLGSVIVFSLLKFYKTEKTIRKKVVVEEILKRKIKK